LAEDKTLKSNMLEWNNDQTNKIRSIILLTGK